MKSTPFHDNTQVLGSYTYNFYLDVLAILPAATSFKRLRQSLRHDR
jgi:hypothetical protein